jgi:6-phosphogluconolactonase
MAGLPAFAQQPQPSERWVYVGSYTEPAVVRGGRGISTFKLNSASGELEPIGEPQAVRNAAFLAFDPMRRFLYAVSDLAEYEDRASGVVTAFAVNPTTGALTYLNEQPTMGPNPVHLSVHPTGRFVLVANSGGSVAILPVRPDGSLGSVSDVVVPEGQPGPLSERQTGPSPRQVTTDPSGAFAIVNDLGLDTTFVYLLELSEGRLIPHSSLAAEPGAGPRQLAFHPAGRWVYRINELNNTMTALEWFPDEGVFRNIQSLSTLPGGFDGDNATAQVSVAPFGKYVYGSNRGHQSIVRFDMDADTGVMEQIDFAFTQGDTPLSFAIDEEGNYLFAANQESGNVVSLRIDRTTGALSSTGVNIDVPSAAGIAVWSPPVGVEAVDGVTFTAFTNPIYQFDGTGLARNSIAWNAPQAQQVEVRLGGPDGATLGRFPNSGGLTTGKWVTNGQTFLLQDVSGDSPTTLATLRIEVLDSIG